ncbi:MAG: hypothetical protein RI996_608 [Candidatus Parcubacteria bacterium]|jgi:hypothetical protein
MNTLSLFSAHIGQLMTQYDAHNEPIVRGKINSVEPQGATLLVHFEWMEECIPCCGTWGSVTQRERRFLVAPVEVLDDMFRMYQNHADQFLKFVPVIRWEPRVPCVA